MFENLLKIIKAAFYFILKAFFLLKILNFLFTFWYIAKTAGLERYG